MIHSSPEQRKVALKNWYEMIATDYAELGLPFMNYGYIETDPNAQQIALDPADEPFRNQIQLYHHVASAVDLTGKRVLEVGCGRGGGTSYIKRYLHPRVMFGIDYAKNAIRLCKKIHQVPGLFFMVGDAEKLPFPEETFDAVVNVESCHAYAYQEKFFAEVQRILRQEGYFLMTDFRSPVGLDELRRSLFRTQFKMLDEKNITRNVFLAMEQDHPGRKELVDRLTPLELRREFESFAGLKGTDIYEGMKNGNARYVTYILQKL